MEPLGAYFTIAEAVLFAIVGMAILVVTITLIYGCFALCYQCQDTRQPREYQQQNEPNELYSHHTIPSLVQPDPYIEVV